MTPKSGKGSDGQDNVTYLQMDAQRAQEVLTEVAEDTSRILITHHARQRMAQRRISATQVLRGIRHGRITEGPVEDLKGGWRMTLDVLAAGDPIRVVLVLSYDSAGHLLIVVTAHTVR